MWAWEGLEEVVAVADSGSFVAAANALGVSTSHVSRAIAQLERRLSAQLFNRTTRKVALTDEGRAFVEQIRPVLRDRDEALASLQGNGEIQGELRITCSVALGERFLAPLAAGYAAAHPKLSVKLELTNHVVDLVGEGFDVGIRTGQVSDGRLIARRVASRRLVLCAAPDYLQRAGTPRTIEDLSSHECLVGARDRWLFNVRGETRAFAPKGRWHCNSGAVLADAAAAGMGLCQTPLFYARHHLERGRLALVLENLRGEDEPIWAVSTQRRILMPKVRNFLDLLARELAKAIASG